MSDRTAWDRLTANVVPGQHVAGRDLIGPYQDHWEASLESIIHPA
jgi:hypothetical protein